MKPPKPRLFFILLLGIGLAMLIYLLIVIGLQGLSAGYHTPNNNKITETTMIIDNQQPKWTQMVSHWGEKMLQTVRDFSSDNSYQEPPPVFARSQEGLVELYKKMQQFAPPRDAQSNASANLQSEAKQAITELDTATLQQGQVVHVKGHVKLTPANANLWQKNISFMITDSDTTLDCQGAILSSTDDNITAISIRTPEHQSQGIQNIHIKNCLTMGYNHGLIIEQQTPANQRYELLQQGKTTLEAQRQQSPHHITIENLMVTYSRNSGIFIGDHVQQVDLYGIGVVHSGTVGLYFEFGSGNNRVSHSYFSQNGFRIGKPNREAIAIDSSANNRIEYSQFDHNGAGAVFLYRNCFEHANDPTKSNHFLRTQGSNANIITHNIFENEPVGVWIAARQSRNLKGFACGAYTISETPFASYHLDEAEQNQVLNNEFADSKNAIIIEDDNNIIKDNHFTANIEQPITIGSKVREQSTEGVVKNNQLVNNEIRNTQLMNNQYSPKLTQRNMVKFVGDSEQANTVKP